MDGWSDSKVALHTFYFFGIFRECKGCLTSSEGILISSLFDLRARVWLKPLSDTESDDTALLQTPI